VTPMLSRAAVAARAAGLLLQMVGVAVAAGAALGLALIATSDPRHPPPCPSYRMHESGGRHGTPHFISFTPENLRRYAESVRQAARRECRLTED